MSLFKKPSDGEGGDFFRPTGPGMFMGTLVELEPCTREKWGAPGVEEDAVRWHWEFRNLDGTDIIDPNTGNVAIITQRTSTSLHKRANGRKYMEAHINRPIQPDEDPDALAEEAVGKSVMLQVGKNDSNDNFSVKLVLPYVKVG